MSAPDGIDENGWSVVSRPGALIEVMTRDTTREEWLILTSAPPSLWREYVESRDGIVIAGIAVACALILYPSRWCVLPALIGAALLVLPLWWWRTERREHAHRVEWARRNIARRRAAREARDG